MVAEVEVKHMKAAEPQLVQRTREVRLDALAMQQEKMQALQKAAAEKAAAKKEKRQRQKERRRAAREQQPPQAEEARDTEAAEEPAEVSAESAGEVKKLKSLLLQRSEQLNPFPAPFHNCGTARGTPQGSPGWAPAARRPVVPPAYGS